MSVAQSGFCQRDIVSSLHFLVPDCVFGIIESWLKPHPTKPRLHLFREIAPRFGGGIVQRLDFDTDAHVLFT
jgi:hypothetical protein